VPRSLSPNDGIKIMIAMAVIGVRQSIVLQINIITRQGVELWQQQSEQPL
jgi:hypothetical protein